LDIFHPQLKLAAEIWDLIRNAADPADRWLGDYFRRNRKRIGSQDRRYLTEAIYACFRHKLFLEAWLKASGQTANTCVFVLCASAAESLLSENNFQELAAGIQGWKFSDQISYQHLKTRVLPPGLSTLSGEEELSLRYSFPNWIVRRWTARYGLEGCRELLETCQARPPLVVRTNLLKISREALVERLIKSGFSARPAARSRTGVIFDERIHLFDSEEFREGLAEVQDEGSQILCETIAPKPTDVVWDMCAGGGGKSLALAALMENKGRIIATDVRLWKLEDLRKRARRAGAFNIFPADIGRMNEIKKMKEGADVILVDAPCSGTGTLRRNPDAKWKLTEARVLECRKDQLEILEKALPYLKKCGKLYYATCSLEPEENEEAVREWAARHPELSAVAIGPEDGYLKLLPSRGGTDGFFMAAFQLQ
jgi:16S rRNA (cytosine967-C5)-methyltransferase